jgi:vacuolar-type H+-ATPase subunit H
LHVHDEGVDVSNGELRPGRARRRGVATACVVAIGVAGVAWSGCGGSSSDSTKSVEQRFEKGLEEAKKGVEKGVEEAQKGLKSGKGEASKGIEKAKEEASKGLEKAKEEAQKGLEKGKEEAKKGVEEAEKYQEEYAP